MKRQEALARRRQALAKQQQALAKQQEALSEQQLALAEQQASANQGMLFPGMELSAPSEKPEPVPTNGTDRKEPEQGKGDGAQEGEPAEEPKKKMSPARRRLFLIVGAIVLVVLAVGAVIIYLHERHFESTDDAFIDGRVTPISAKVAAHVLHLLVNDNEDVTVGQLLLELDPRDFDARLDSARAQLEVAVSKERASEVSVGRARDDLEAAEADVVAAESEADRTATDSKRYQSAGNAVTKQSADNAKSLAASTGAQLRASQKKAAASKTQILSAEADVAQARATIEEMRAQVREAELQLSYTRITAPVAGRVTRRSVEVGAYVQPGESLLALVPREVWVTANFRETQLEYMRAGQSVVIGIDAFSDRKLRGHVDSFERGSGARFSLLPPENATGNYVKVVQRVPVKIVFDEALPPDRDVGLGMSVVPTVTVR